MTETDIEFQFQTGSIRSDMENAVRFSVEAEFQFQTGSIKRFM